MVWGKILRTRVPHARITRIDTTRAGGAAGRPGRGHGPERRSAPVRLREGPPGAQGVDVVRCIRDEVAAVAARDRGDRGGGLPADRGRVRGAARGLRPRGGAPPGGAADPPQCPGQPGQLHVQVHGTATSTAPSARRDVVVEGTYRLNYVTTACLGTMAAIAQWDPRGNAHDVVDDPDPVPLPARPGGGARHLRRPDPGHPAAGRRQLRPRARPLPDRHHHRAPGPARPPAGEDRVRPGGGVRREPDARAVRLHAAHGGPGDGTLARAGRARADRQRRLHLLGIDDAVRDDDDARRFYRCPNMRFDTAIVYTNNVYSGSMRGYGNLESTFAVEAQMDDLAERLGLDRLEIRRRNANRPGRRDAAGPSDHELCASWSASTRSARDIAPARRAAAPARLRRGDRLRRHVPRRRRRARLPLRRLRRDRQARRLRQGHADHRRQRDRAGLGDRPGDDRRRGAGHAARTDRRREQRHGGQALGRRRPREPDDVHRRQRRAPGGAGREAAAPRARRPRARRAGRGARRRGRVRVRYGGAPAPDGVRARRPGRHFREGGRILVGKRSTTRRPRCWTRTSGATCR